MNPVIKYAIDHQEAARPMLISHGIPSHDCDDVFQSAVVRVLITNPRIRKGTATYWYKALRSAASQYWRRCSRLPFSFSYIGGDSELTRDREDPRQDLGHQIDVSETLRQAGDIFRAATPKVRGAMTAHLRGERMDNAQRQYLHRLRKRLRAAVA